MNRKIASCKNNFSIKKREKKAFLKNASEFEEILRGEQKFSF